MKKIIFIVDTVFQLCTAYEMKINLFRNDYVTVVLSASTPGFKKMYIKNKLDKCFDNVMYCDWKQISGVTGIRSPMLIGYKKSEAILKKVYGYELNRYDAIFTTNRFNIFFLILNILKKKNKNILKCEYDEGLDCYIHERPRSPKGKFDRMIDKLFYYGKHDLFDLCYLTEPKYYSAYKKKEIRQLPKLTDEFALKKINEAFEFDYNTIIKNKYIFLEEADDNVSDKNKYRDLINSIIKMVGKDNIVIKRHPRNINPIGYKDVKVIELSVPWELFVLNGLVKGKVVFSLASSASFNSLFLSEDDMKSVVLYKLDESLKNASIISYGKKFESFVSKVRNDDKRLVVPENLAELEKIL